ncbi:DUF6503 family protein [Flavilitoribacter nigricans]|uniref:Deoxyribose-phosphate aldolase n=1 Tax=Flavilitoribacter nigricans (strain ATCC 23147 / DSM 23189 / NBRC 102662 / NCIMB 1420 / SS-2) TaxID=1122177 RepID=A0A2D0N4N7_FLAN2|nr:DUF6503 family protein [Flavilitoribacter nigricans]PHN03350.1 hypothetical protein CRP01_27075 [Flavilitoribacter nigricans DSM 23189 = NBRC 102662]
MKNTWYILLLLILWACGNESGDQLSQNEGGSAVDSAQWVIDKAISAHGGDKVDNSHIEFDFRDRHYISDRQGGAFTYERIWQDTTGDQYRDVLTNDRLYREINGERVELSAKDSSAYANSTNSVLYFALLPYYLNDPAVRKTYLGQGDIKGQTYHKVKVTFRQADGGKDFEDEFVYWIHQDDFTMDYFAYNYIVDGGGARFREAYNVRTIDGIRFADYVNYRPEPEIREVATFDRMFNEGKMKELSRIESEDISVQLR